METPRRMKLRPHASAKVLSALSSAGKPSSHIRSSTRKRKKSFFSTLATGQNDDGIEGSPPASSDSTDDHNDVSIGSNENTSSTSPSKTLNRHASRKRPRRVSSTSGEDLYQIQASPQAPQRPSYILESETSRVNQQIIFSDRSDDSDPDFHNENLDVNYPILGEGSTSKPSIGNNTEHGKSDSGDNSARGDESQSGQEGLVDEARSAALGDSVVYPSEGEGQGVREEATTGETGGEQQELAGSLEDAVEDIDIPGTKETAPDDSWGTSGEQLITQLEQEELDEDYEPSATEENENATLDSNGRIDDEPPQRNTHLKKFEWNSETDLGSSEVSARQSSTSTDTETDTDDGLRDEATFLDESRVFEQEDNWRDLVSEARKLIKQTKGMTCRSCKNMFGSISSIRETYEETRFKRIQGVSELKLLEDERAGLRDLDKRYIHVKRDLAPLPDIHHRSTRKRLVSAIREVETDIVPLMVALLQACMASHYTNDKLSENGLKQVIEILDYLAGLCKLVHPEEHKPNLHIQDTLKTTRIIIRFMQYVFKAQVQKIHEQRPLVNGQTGAHLTEEPLSEKVLQTEIRRTEREASIQLVESPIVEEFAPFTAAEGDALISGLSKHTGQRRYELIKREFKAVLRNRTTEDLRRQACHIRDGLLALPEDERPDRAQWGFILDLEG